MPDSKPASTPDSAPPQDSPPTPPPSEEPTLPPPTPPATKPRFPRIVLGILFAVVLALVGYFAYQYFVLGRPINLSLLNRSVPSQSSSPTASTPGATPSGPTVVASPIPGSTNMLAYIRTPETSDSTDYRIWLIDPASGAESELDIDNATEALKYYGSPLLFYLPRGDEGEYRVRNLETGEETSYTLITHPQSDVTETVTIYELNQVSPDGKWLVFQAEFYEPCPSPSPVPSGGYYEGFPCMPDENLDTPAGYYLYDLTSRRATPLSGDYIHISTWDTANQKLYYVAGSVTYALDLHTLTASVFDSTPNFGYYTYPILSDSYKLAKFEAATGNSGESAFGKLTLVDDEGSAVKTIDSVDDWAILQPFMVLSPDGANLLYSKTYILGDGLRRFYINKYNLADDSTTRITPEDDGISVDLRGQWIDANTYVNAVDTIETDNYTNVNNYLVKIDLSSGTNIRLTTHDEVYRFNHR